MNHNKLIAIGLILTIGVFLAAGCIGGRQRNKTGENKSVKPTNCGTEESPRDLGTISAGEVKEIKLCNGQKDVIKIKQEDKGKIGVSSLGNYIQLETGPSKCSAEDDCSAMTAQPAGTEQIIIIGSDYESKPLHTTEKTKIMLEKP